MMSMCLRQRFQEQAVKSMELISQRKLKDILLLSRELKLQSSYSCQKPEIPKYVVIKARFKARNDVARYILRTAVMFKEATRNLLEFVKKNDIDVKKKRLREYLASISYKWIPNRKYAVGVGLIAEEILKSCRNLHISLGDVELGNWMMFQSPASKWDYGNRNIRLISKDAVRILLFTNENKTERFDIKIKPNKGVMNLFEKLSELGLKRKIGYLGRVVVKEFTSSFCYCELQLGVPTDFYIAQKRKHNNQRGDNVAGVDINTDRFDCVIISRNLEIINIKSFRFPAKPRGEKKERRRTILMQKLHELLEFCYENGVSVIATENPNLLGVMRARWIKAGKRVNKNYNYKVSTFNHKILYDLPIHAMEYGMKVVWVNPKNTSKDGERLGKELGLDKHMGSALTIALRGLANINKINNYQA